MTRRGIDWRPPETRQSDFARYRADPGLFVREALALDPWERQLQILSATAEHSRVAVRSSHHSGKTWVAAALVHWFTRAFDPSLVLTTAPTDRQVRELLWYEIARQQRHAGMAGRMTETSLEVSGTQRAFGFSTNTPERFQGWHCLRDDHQILTRRGWLGIDEMTTDDEVLSVPVDGDIAEWMPVTDVHRYPFHGELNVYGADGGNVSFAVTDEHRFVVHGQEDVPSWRLEAFSDLKSLSYIRRVAGWRGEPLEVPEPFRRYEWSAEQFAEFLGFWIGDGGLRMHGKTGRFYEVLLYQVRPDGGYSRGLLPNVRVQTGRDHVVFCDRSCAEWLAENVGRYGAERRIPRAVLDAPPRVLEAFCEGFWRAEGSFVRGEKRGVYNSNAALMDQVQEVLIKIGKPTTIGVNRSAGSSKRADGRDFLMRRDCLRLSWPERTADHHLLKNKVRRERHQGRVWCISTPYQTFYTRHRGRVFLSGNSPNILIIVDEASGVPENIYEAIEGCLTGPNAHLLLIGNPNNAAGTFYNAFRSPLYQTFHISAYDVPERLLPPGWAEERRQEWGEESPAYHVRVLGNFPEQGEDSLISMRWVTDAQERKIEPKGAPDIGVDIARFGSDESVAYVRRGSQAYPGVMWRGNDTMESAGRVVALAGHWTGALIKVDEIGVGAGVLDRLKEQGIRASGVNVGEAAWDSEHFANRRAEIFWGLRERFRTGDIAIPADDTTLLAQLTSLRFSYTSRGQIKLESKEDMRKRGLPSPDRADALAIAFAAGRPFALPGASSGQTKQTTSPWATKR